MISDEADEVIKKLFNLLNNLKSSEVAFDYVHLLYYKCHRLNLNSSMSCIDSPD